MNRRIRDPIGLRRDLSPVRRAAEAAAAKGSAVPVDGALLAELFRGYDDGGTLRRSIEALDGTPLARELGDKQSVLIVMERDGRFVAVRQRKREGRLELPGGKLRANEPPMNAAKREALEETGVHLIADLTLHEVGAVLVPLAGNLWRMRVYAGKVGPHTTPRGSDEGEACWATREEIIAHDVFGRTYMRVFALYARWQASETERQRERDLFGKNLA